MKFAMLCNIISGIFLTAIYFIFTRQIVSIFINDEPVIEAGINMLRCLMFSSPVIGILFVFNFSFQAMGKALASLSLAVSRQGFVFLPAIILLDRFMGLKGIVLAQPIADYVSIAMALCIFLYMNRGFKKLESMNDTD